MESVFVYNEVYKTQHIYFKTYYLALVSST